MANTGSFLGSGLLRPFQRDGKNDFANGVGIDVIRSCVGQILGTRAADDSFVHQGEIPWRQNFGSKLYLLKHRKGPMLTEMARVYVVDALRRWEPRVQVTAVDATFSLDQRTLTVNIRYNVITRNVGSNQVLFTNVDQTVEIPMAA